MNSVARVCDYLAQFPYKIQVIEFEESTKTAQDIPGAHLFYPLSSCFSWQEGLPQTVHQ